MSYTGKPQVGQVWESQGNKVVVKDIWVLNTSRGVAGYFVEYLDGVGKPKTDSVETFNKSYTLVP